jgi:hypothetical protein
MILELAKTADAVAPFPTLRFRSNQQRLSPASTVRTIISSHVWKLLLSLSSFEFPRLLAKNSKYKSILERYAVPAFDESELSTRQPRPG